MSLVERIKELAKKRGKNLKQVAIENGLGENALYRWDKNSPSTDNLRKVADYFNVSVDYLLGRTDNPRINDDDDDMLVAAHMYEDLTDEELEEIKRFIEFTKSKHRGE